MNIEKSKFEHLIKNLDRIPLQNSIFNFESGRKAFLKLGHGNPREWLEDLLPNTRLILEPKIIGSIIGIQYINGSLNKGINVNSGDITEVINTISTIPKKIAIKKRIEIQGVLYDKEKKKFDKNKRKIFLITQNTQNEINRLNFCAFHIFHCKINHFQALKELKKLCFEIPDTQFTNFISDIEIYRQYWIEGMLFQNYPTSGIVLKINSRKLQKYLGENNLSINWAYAIT